MVLIGRNDKINFSSIFDKKKMIYEFERFAISYGLTLIIKRVNWLSAGPLNLRALCGCTVRTPLRPPLVASSESMTRVNHSTRVTIFGGSTRITFFIVWHDPNRVTINGVRVIYKKSPRISLTNTVHLHTKKWAFLLQWWSILAQIFGFDCVS